MVFQEKTFWRISQNTIDFGKYGAMTMGGSGSGYRGKRKLTVNESLTFSIWSMKDQLFHYSSWTATWNKGGKNVGSIGCRVMIDGEQPLLLLNYCTSNHEPVRMEIDFQTTRTNFNGRRWWFTCPIVENGIECNRRVGKLHLPQGATYFGCRKCYDLSYQSSQQAHHVERIYRGLDFDYRAYAKFKKWMDGGKKSRDRAERKRKRKGK